MKQRIFAIACALCLVTACVFPAFAASPRLVDEAGLLSGAEAAEVEHLLDEISTRQGLDIVVVTVDSTDGAEPMDFADDYFDYHDYAADGILLLVAMEESDWWVSTTGYGITAVTDAGLEYMADRFVPMLSDGDYAEAFRCFANLCDEFVTRAKTGDPYDSHNLPKAPFAVIRNLLIALGIGLVAALIATGSMKKKLKSVAMQARADEYVTPGSLQLTHSRDFHLYTHIDRREKPQASSGSTTHVSSSGTTHGGGGGKF